MIGVISKLNMEKHGKVKFPKKALIQYGLLIFLVSSMTMKTLKLESGTITICFCLNMERFYPEPKENGNTQRY